MKIPRKTWLYFILDANNFSYSWDRFAQMPVKNPSISPRFIPQNPTGWKDIEIQAATNLKYFSLNRTFATDIKFVNDAANILRWFSYNERGYDNDMYLLIMKWNRTNGEYDVEYKGKIDYTTFKDFVRTGVQIDTKEGGVIEYLNANDSIVEEIACDETNPDIKQVQFDGINLEDTFNYQWVSDVAPTQLAYSLPIVFLTNEGDNIGIVKNDNITIEDAGSFDYVVNSNNYILYSVYGITNIRIKGSLTLIKNPDDIYPSDEIEFGLTAATSLHHNYNLINDGNYKFGVPIPFDITISLVANEKLFIVGGSNPLTPGFIQFGATEFTISFNSKNAVSTSYCLTWYDWYKQMVLKISDGKYTGDSAILASRPDLVVTCGDALRNSDRTIVPSYKIASSFADGFKSMSSILCLGLEVRDGVLWCEKLTDIYASDPAVEPEIFDLDEIAGVDIEAASDLLINEISCGFSDQDYDERNGKYEFNSEQNWKAPVTLPAQQVYDIRSVWRGDAFGIEFIRAKYTKLDTTDNQGDKQAFMVQVGSAIAQTNFKAQQTAALDYASADKIIYNAYSGDNFTHSDDNKTITFTGIKQVVNISVVLAITNDGAPAQFIILKNGASVGSFIHSGGTTGHLITGILLATGDTLQISVVQLGSNPTFTVNFLDFNIIFTISVFAVYRDVYTSITGVLDNTVYNVNFSPKRQILAHKEYLGGLLKQMQLDSLVLSSSKKNVELTTVLGGVTIAEKVPIPVNTLTPVLFLPYYCRFKCKPQYSFASTITAINGGYISGTENGNVLYMLAFGQMLAKPALNEVQEWKLLLAPNNILSNLLKLSQAGLFIQFMGNLLFISDLNPVHFVKYDSSTEPGYHFQDMYDNWVKERNVRWGTKRNFVQPWQIGDEIRLQFITANLGSIQIDVKDCDGNSVISRSTDIIVDSSVPLPYQLQQITLSGLSVGSYWIVISYQGIILAISETQLVQANTLAYRYDYSSSFNLLYGYFTQWKPYLRCESMFMQWQPKSEFEEYEDDPSDIELIDGRTNMFRNLILGTPDGINGIGLPDFMANKMNNILLLNQCFIENEHYVRSTDSKVEPTQAQGNPFDFYTVAVQKAITEKGLSFTGIQQQSNGIISYTLNARGFGMNEGILTFELEDES